MVYIGWLGRDTRERIGERGIEREGEEGDDSSLVASSTSDDSEVRLFRGLELASAARCMVYISV